MPVDQASGNADSLQHLGARLREFARLSDWEKFHSPKNLSMAVASEAGELLAHFRWHTEAESLALNSTQLAQVGAELADILNLTVQLADRLKIDLLRAAHDKISLNETRYPVDKSRGTAKKYNEL